MIRGFADGELFVVRDYSEEEVENVLEEFFNALKRTWEKIWTVFSLLFHRWALKCNLSQTFCFLSFILKITPCINMSVYNSSRWTNGWNDLKKIKFQYFTICVCTCDIKNVLMYFGVCRNCYSFNITGKHCMKMPPEYNKNKVEIYENIKLINR